MARTVGHTGASLKPSVRCWFFVARVAVYAIGGNALASPTGGDDGQSERILAHVMSDVVDLLESGWGVVLTHGNGPQVGHLMALDTDLTQPMDAWVSATQGMIGHGLALNLDSILSKRQRPERTATIVTRVLVDGNDPGFSKPTKPVGPVLNAQTVMEADWDIAETKIGPRRVVASPLPMEIIDLPVIQKLVDLHAVVICGGGGGIPIAKKGQHFIGVPAVIDKDRVSASCRAVPARRCKVAPKTGYRIFGDVLITGQKFLTPCVSNHSQSIPFKRFACHLLFNSLTSCKL